MKKLSLMIITALFMCGCSNKTVDNSNKQVTIVSVEDSGVDTSKNELVSTEDIKSTDIKYKNTEIKNELKEDVNRQDNEKIKPAKIDEKPTILGSWHNKDYNEFYTFNENGSFEFNNNKDFIQGRYILDKNKLKLIISEEQQFGVDEKILELKEKSSYTAIIIENDLENDNVQEKGKEVPKEYKDSIKEPEIKVSKENTKSFLVGYDDSGKEIDRIEYNIKHKELNDNEKFINIKLEKSKIQIGNKEYFK